MKSKDLDQDLIDQVNSAIAHKTPLVIVGGNSKTFYGNRVTGEIISTAGHTGITEYQPSELVVTVRSGTLLSELEAELKANKQMLAFEPPQHSEKTTIGGIIACGMSGPRRMATGSARDFILGTTIINGKAEKCRFGGQVMKNVAGYDAARLMVAAQGTLGVLLDISIKVLPIPESSISIKVETELQPAIKSLRQWLRQGLPISASCHYQDNLYLRLSSTPSAVKQSLTVIKNQYSSEQMDESFWSGIKNQTHEFFTGNNDGQQTDLWRFSHNDAAKLLAHSGGAPSDQLFEWHGTLCWTRTGKEQHTLAEQHQGNATRYTLHQAEPKAGNDIFQPLQPGLLKIHQRLKQAFDPDNILNPGRLYTTL
ncbi:MAG: glycolate oxidase subunit GlcE [Proteobacteria bacterium]|nr:glycolate oxidase subunit GlcE [Pseudomonadota bacterium]